MSKRFALLASAAALAFAVAAPRPRFTRRWRRRLSLSAARRCTQQEHRPERGEFQDHTTLVAAVKAAGLVEVLEGPGPFTVFAPTNEAFAKLPAGTVDTLLKPENKEMLVKVLTYHVVPGRVRSADLMKQIKAGNGKAELKTVNGETLTATMNGKHIVLTDEKGDNSMVTIANVFQSNGVIHVVDTVLLPM